MVCLHSRRRLLESQGACRDGERLREMLTRLASLRAATDTHAAAVQTQTLALHATLRPVQAVKFAAWVAKHKAHIASRRFSKPVPS